MKTMTKMMLGAAMLALVAGCGGESPSADNQTAAMNEHSMDNSMAADPANPYGQAEMQMHERMTAAVGTDVSDTWVKKMVEHHRGAVEMSNIVMAQGAQGPVLEMARMTIEKQSKEIKELEAIAKQGPGSPEAAAAYREVETQMHDRTMAAKGADPSETWIRKMVEHHRGAVAMSEIAAAQTQDARVRAMALKTAADQTKEIATLEGMLSGAAAPATPAAAPPPPPPAAPKAAPKAEPKTKIAPKPKAEPKATPKAEPAPSPKAECLPEHRAAGHC